MAEEDYYEVLGVNHDADSKTIKEAYRQLAFQYHPDRSETGEQSADMMKRVNEAYAVLSHPEKRQAYDAMRTRYGDNAYGQFRNAYSQQDIFNGSDVYRVFEEMARSFGLRGVDDIFSDFYGPGYRKFEFKRHGLHGKGFIYRGAFGKRGGRAMAGQPPKSFGRFARYLLQKATGLSLPKDGEDIYDTIHLSPEFARTGGPYPYRHRQRDKKLVVNIPSGTRSGQRIRLAQMGALGKNGGIAGDLFLKVKLKKPLLEKAKDFVVSTFSR